MSRSWKKNPVIKDSPRKAKKFLLRKAARRVRKAEDVPDGGAYRKLYDRYSICDWVFRKTFEEYVASKERLELHIAMRCGCTPETIDRRDLYRKWHTIYRGK